MSKIIWMETFCHVVQQRSFSSAGRSLGISKAMVSRHINALESELGVRLLERTTRSLNTTSVGQFYYQRCRDLLNDFLDLDSLTKEYNQTPQGILKLSLPSEGVTKKLLSTPLTDFSKKHPKVSLNIMLGNQYIDLIKEGVDLAIRIGKLADSSLIAKKLGEMDIILCASSDYVSKTKRPSLPDDLYQHRLITSTNYREGLSWRLERNGDIRRVKIDGNSLVINSSVLAKDLVLAGLGISLCPSFLIAEELRSGQLIQILPDWALTKGGIYAIYPHRKSANIKVNLLLEQLSSHFSQLDLSYPLSVTK